MVDLYEIREEEVRQTAKSLMSPILQKTSENDHVL